jgi:uncharacterized protein
MRVRFFLIVLCVVFTLSLRAQSKQHVSLFKLQDVHLLPGVFKEAEETDLKYILSLDVDRLLAPYLREAGLPKKTESYTNWENSGLDGHTGGHYLSALSMMYASTGNKQVMDRLNYMVNELKRCQDAGGDGYIGGVPGSKSYWAEIKNGNIAAQRKKWVPLYNIHKVYAGLRDAYVFTNNEKAKEMLVKFSDWFVNLAAALGPQQMEEMLRTEHGGNNEVLADVYAFTGDKKYLEAAYRFSHKAILQPLENRQDNLDNLHANTQIPKIVGFKRIGDLQNDTAYNNAAAFFWETVVKNRTIAIGGNSVREHFNPANNFSSMVESEEGPETCNTYNMLRLTKLFYQSHGLIKYVDFYERALYNHILSSQYPRKGGFVYFTPMRPGFYRVYSQPQTSMWCCVGTGMENHAKYAELIYAHDDNDLYVNLFIPSQLRWAEKGLTVTQQTRFPEEEKTVMTVNSSTGKHFGIKLRYPSWVAKDAIRVLVNGKTVNVSAEPSSYITLNRLWKKGDKIELLLPMTTKAEVLPDGLNYVALLHGPIVLAAKTDTSNIPFLFSDDSRMGHVATGIKYPLSDMPMFVTSKKDLASEVVPVGGKSMTFKTPGIVYPKKFESLELIPFYKIHASRYVIYWQVETSESLAIMQTKLAAAEKERQRLELVTIDMVRPGEQQPEIEHSMESNQSRTGVFHDRHFRDARGWFSYLLTDKDKHAGSIKLTLWGGDKDRHFKVLVNDEVIDTVALNGSRPGEFYTVDCTIPDKVVQNSNGHLRVKFLAADSSGTGGIYEVRLLKK